jgi:hypothetical protein
MLFITAHLGARELPKSSGSKKERKKMEEAKEARSIRKKTSK